MIRGTTAELRFEVPYNWDDLNSVTVIVWQDGNDGPDKSRPLPIKKTKRGGSCTHLDTDKYVVVTTLTVEETARFRDDRKAKAQLVAFTNSKIRYATKEKLITVYPMPDDVIFDDPDLPPESDELVILDGGVI